VWNLEACRSRNKVVLGCPFKASTKFAQKKGFNKSATIMVRNPQEKEEQRILY
jgi:hypothetical protein